jgi:hypothetical protein
MKKFKKIKSVKAKMIPNVNLPLTELKIIMDLKKSQNTVRELKNTLKDFFSRID